jgi:hypothetical protein
MTRRVGRPAAVTVQNRFRVTLLATGALLVATSIGASGARSQPGPIASPFQTLAVLLGPHQAFSKPSRDSLPLARVRVQRPVTGERTVLPVLGETTGADGLSWLHVRLPGRPNGQTGWIRQYATLASTTAWHVVVETSRRLVLVYRDGRLVRTFKAVVGKPSTPTPHGEFFVEESVELRSDDPGAPFALALSARSEVLQEFAGGPGQIALHGLGNVGGIPGRAVSHGCVRLDAQAMRWLVARIGPGVPVTITS